jgi:hypothetical protein
MLELLEKRDSLVLVVGFCHEMSGRLDWMWAARAR